MRQYPEVNRQDSDKEKARQYRTQRNRDFVAAAIYTVPVGAMCYGVYAGSSAGAFPVLAGLFLTGLAAVCVVGTGAMYKKGLDMHEKFKQFMLRISQIVKV